MHAHRSNLQLGSNIRIDVRKRKTSIGQFANKWPIYAFVMFLWLKNNTKNPTQVVEN